MKAERGPTLRFSALLRGLQIRQQVRRGPQPLHLSMASSWFSLDALKRLTEPSREPSREPGKRSGWPSSRRAAGRATAHRRLLFTCPPADRQPTPTASPRRHAHRAHPSPSKRTPEEEEAFRAQERIGSELRAVRRAAAAADKDVGALSKAVHALEKETLLFGDLENYLAVIEAEIEAINATLQRVQAGSEGGPGGAVAGVAAGGQGGG